MKSESQTIQQLCSFYLDCHVASTATSSLTNFFSSKVENGYVFKEKEQLLNNELPYYPIDSKKAITIQKKLSLAPHDIELIHCAIFLKAEIKGINGQAVSIIAPLLTHPAKIHQKDEFHYLSIDQTKRKLNLAPLKLVSKESKKVSRREIDDITQSEQFDFQKIARLKQFIQDHYPDVNTEQLLLFPQPVKEKQLKSEDLEYENPYLLFASGFGVVKRSKETFGISGELKKMISGTNFSLPTQSIFGFQACHSKIQPDGVIPALLNNAQKRAIENVNKYPLSVISGPPGTGKSFTIASIAIDQLSKGKSTLIVTQNNHALNVINHKIKHHLQLKHVVFDGGAKSDIQDLKKHLSHILSRSFVKRAIPEKELELLEKRKEKHSYALAQIEKDFLEEVNNEINWSNFLNDKGRLQRYIVSSFDRYAEYLSKKKKAHWELSDLLHEITIRDLEEKREFIREKHLFQLENTIKNSRGQLRTFLNALKASTTTRKKHLFEQIDFKKVFKAFPIWLVTVDDLHRVFPLQTEMFDTVVIDEASQCTISASLPAIDRAKTAVIVGDQKQLRHVSFLSLDEEEYLREKNNVDHLSPFEVSYRNKSILDIALETAYQEAIVFLNEHYRSAPSLIQFSNNNFYHGDLQIMSDRPDNEHQGIKLEYIEGNRTPSGYNKKEAEAILTRIQEIVNEEEEIDHSLCHTIGVLSPFRKQVDHISQVILKTFSLKTIQKHRLIVGTAHAFQGGERDIMLLSLTLDDNTHKATFNFINRDDVFNVSITRAIKEQIIYHSFNPQKLSPGTLLFNYIHNSRKYLSGSEIKNTYRDEFLNDVIAYCEENNISNWPLYYYTNIEIDLLIKWKDEYIAIDLIGYPGQTQQAFPIERYKTLKRCGITPFPLGYSKWKYQQQDVLRQLFK